MNKNFKITEWFLIIQEEFNQLKTKDKVSLKYYCSVRVGK